MHIYEVIFWSSRGNRNSEDTIYLVRAPDFLAAVSDVCRNASPSDHNGDRAPLAHAVFEIGNDLSPYAISNPGILRGPYFAVAVNHGWKAWHRKLDGPEYTEEWEERI